MTSYTKSQIVNQLRQSACTVTFTKVNGDKRVMPCTLQEDALPQVNISETKTARKPNDDVVSAWCTDKKAWRSFRVDSVSDITVIKHNSI